MLQILFYVATSIQQHHRKKLLALRYKLVAEGASSEEICRQTAELIRIEQDKARERRKRKTDKKFAQVQQRERIFKSMTDEGIEVNNLLSHQYRIGVQQNTLAFQTTVSYNWTIPLSSNVFFCVRDFTFEGANKTELCTILPDSYILVLHKLDKNGKKCGKLYVDMFFKIFVKLTKTELETLF
jgi:hypothetical protein